MRPKKPELAGIAEGDEDAEFCALLLKSSASS